MIIQNNYSKTPNFEGLNKRQMRMWKELNRIPRYTDASYDGFTGGKFRCFPTSAGLEISNYPDVTADFHKFESEILQELISCREKRFGYVRALWRLCQNFGTGDPWDSKFLPRFPGRTKYGKKQYAVYNNEIVSANDLSNRVYGHVCRFMGIPTKLALIIAKMDASGILEPFSKGKLPSLKLLRFRDPASDQQSIVKGINEFDMSNYKIK